MRRFARAGFHVLTGFMICQILESGLMNQKFAPRHGWRLHIACIWIRNTPVVPNAYAVFASRRSGAPGPDLCASCNATKRRMRSLKPPQGCHLLVGSVRQTVCESLPRPLLDIIWSQAPTL